jgi:hypothetical protein
MNGQYFGDRFNPSGIAERTEQDTNSPAVNSDVFADKVPVDATVMHETPMGGTVAAIDRMDGTLVNEIPVGETGAVVDLTDEALIHEAPQGENILYMAPAVGAMVDESRVIKPVSETKPYETPTSPPAVTSAAVLNREESEHFRTRWNEIQGTFVDEPRTAVQQADALVSEVIGQITQMFASNHSALENQWKQGNDDSTEDLRKALQQYRAFFNRLVV